MPAQGGNIVAAIGEAVTTNPWEWDKFTLAWVVWILWFFFWEAWAIIEGGPQTFSHHIWWLRNNGPSIVFFLIVAIVTWLVYHFVFEGRT